MSKEDIITLPNAALRKPSKKVGIITDAIKTVVQEMKDATLDWEASRTHEVGVALAAIQIDQPLRIVVIRNDFDNKDDKTFTVFINPEITKYAGDIEQDFEGCLSVPEIYAKVPRHTKVRVRAQDEDGHLFRVTAEGFLARVFQHEVDHTNGIVFIDHIKEEPSLFYRLQENGELTQLDYEKDIKHNNILW